MKPFLTDVNKITRLDFAKYFVNLRTEKLKMDELGESMDHLFLSDEDATYAAINELKPLQLIEYSNEKYNYIVNPLMD